MEKYIKVATDFFPAVEVSNWSNTSYRTVYIKKDPSLTLSVVPGVLDFATVPVQSEKTLRFTVIPETDNGLPVSLQYTLTGGLMPSVETDVIDPVNNSVINQETVIQATGMRLEQAVRVRNINYTSGQQQVLLTVTSSLS
ncbi:MAG: hypothetical protein RSA95_00435 [Citrobacter sp.]|uniref:hypothetical protein n=1 Tax=Citrobacter sp. TaxID=1896336 RepID=UPI002FCA08B4